MAINRTDNRDKAKLAQGLEERISAAVVEALYQNIPLLLLANLFIAAITAYTFYDHQVLPWAALLWLVGMVAVSLWRLWMVWHYRRDANRHLDSPRWLRLSLYGSLVSGLLLGLTAFGLLYAREMELIYFLLLVVVGMLAGSSTSLTAHLPTFRAYYFSVALPFIVATFALSALESGRLHDLFSIAVMLAVYAVIVYFFGLKAHRNLLQGLKHRFEHEQLAQELASEIRKREDAQEELMLASRIIANVKEGIVVTDQDNRIIRINDTFSKITGYSQQEVAGKNPSLVGSGKQDRAFYQQMWRALSKFDEWEGEIWNRRKNGEIYPEWLSISVIRDHDGNVSNYVGWFRDITERKREEERLAYLANYDVLTGLPNRSLFMEQLDIALADCTERGELLAVLFIDLNLFKQVNDTHGHDVGDMVLRQVSLRLKSVVREGDLVARLGGDEFIIMLRNLHDGSDVEAVANKLVEEIEPKFRVNDIECTIGFSIGISLAPLDAVERKELLRCADEAMYRAKQDRSRSRWHMCQGSASRTA